jgi:hypothetical protein
MIIIVLAAARVVVVTFTVLAGMIITAGFTFALPFWRLLKGHGKAVTRRLSVYAFASLQLRRTRFTPRSPRGCVRVARRAKRGGPARTRTRNQTVMSAAPDRKISTKSVIIASIGARSCTFVHGVSVGFLVAQDRHPVQSRREATSPDRSRHRTSGRKPIFSKQGARSHPRFAVFG